jgi:putative ABC transport system substrate-binding protein
LSEVGFVEGRNLVIEYRWAENQYDRLPALGAGSSSPSGGGDCHARWKCGVTCCEAGDHHDSSRVLWQRRPGRMNRPGGNVTGVVTLNIDTGQKRLELGSTTARSGDEVALIADTISHYPPVLIASLSNNSSRRRPRKKTQPVRLAGPLAYAMTTLSGRRRN